MEDSWNEKIIKRYKMKKEKDKTNIFTKIGNSIEKSKEDKRKIKDKYWKLSPVERIDYDNQVKKIKENNKTDSFFSITKMFLGAIAFILIFLGMFAFGINYGFYNYLNLIKPLVLAMTKPLMIFFMLDVLIIFAEIIFSKETSTEIKKLNKRYKL